MTRYVRVLLEWGYLNLFDLVFLPEDRYATSKDYLSEIRKIAEKYDLVVNEIYGLTVLLTGVYQTYKITGDKNNIDLFEDEVDKFLLNPDEGGMIEDEKGNLGIS